jgi:predicted component of type VI protein secretion system
LRLVVEHVRGHRRGEREVFDDPERVSFGRHPQNDVTFDPKADIDASSRHAEIRREGDAYVLRDVGSSNGTFVEGELIHEHVLRPETAVHLDLGAGGPRVRIWLGEGDHPPSGDQAGGRDDRRAAARVLAAAALATALGVALWLAF